MSSLLLASRSPRRKEILRFLGIPFRAVAPVGVVEKQKKSEKPWSLVRRLALEKARSISRKFPRSYVLGADTVVVKGGKIFGKPKNRAEAARMLMGLQNSSHEVWTGVALLCPGGKVSRTAVENTKVFFKPFSLGSIDDYLNSAEPYDKAGGYNIQGAGRGWVKKWEGDYFNVVGLPVGPVLEMINRLNLGR